MKTKKMIITLAAALLFFGGMNVTWFVYRYRHFSAIVSQNSEFKKCKDCDRKVYQLEKNGVTATVFFPKYLTSNGNYCVVRTTPSDEYDIGIAAKPHLFKELKYKIDVRDHTDHDAKYYFEVDRNFNVVFEMGDSEKILKKDGDEIREMFEVAKKYFDH